MLEARAISRRFGPRLALERVDFTARPGEIHALVGENGAGKSTLINIVAGRLRPDAGSVILDGVRLPPGVARAALRAGIAAVYQAAMLFERMTWEENLALAGFASAGRRQDPAAAAARAAPLAASLGFALPAAATRVEELSVAARVRLEILRALSFTPRVLILDEPTSVLAPGELASFLELLRRLRDAGRVVVLITHKLAEALALADRITVLRQGRVVAERIAAETDEAELARLMVGEHPRAPAAVRDAARPAVPVLHIAGLTLERGGRRPLDRVELTVHAGEIVGVAGVDGNGQHELIEVLAALDSPTAGAVHLAGPADAGAIAVIPQNRERDGLVLEMPLWENLLLAAPLRARFCPAGGLARRRAIGFCAELLERFQIRADGATSPAQTLSGGNRQRLVVARALAGVPRVLVAHDMCRGLDLRATAEVHRLIREFAAAGGAVLLLSGDLDELFALCDRLAVLCRGQLSPVPPDGDAERVGLMMAGVP